MPIILHQAENFLLAELPEIESGVRLLLSKVGDEVRLHRLAPGQPASSSALPVQAIDAIYQAIHSQG